MDVAPVVNPVLTLAHAYTLWLKSSKSMERANG
jgi:hypothetical protein